MKERTKVGIGIETVAVAFGGGALGWALGSLIGAAGLVGALATANGAIAGMTGMYDWRRPNGWGAFVADSTWALIGTAIALILHIVQLFYRRARYRFDLSHRANLHIYEGGFSMKPAYAFSTGNVISNAGGKAGLDGDRGERRWTFIQNHEFLHVFQNRVFGPAFQLAYVGWMLGGALWGLVAWARYRRGLGRLIETAAYFNNPFEYWAYRRDDYWPPKDADDRIVWGARRMARSPRRKT